MASLRPTGEREHALHKVLLALQPAIEQHMRDATEAKARGEATGRHGRNREEDADGDRDEVELGASSCRATQFLHASLGAEALSKHRSMCR